ncbi:MAG: PHP domain-containing protein, partial [Candidatus Eisenbacteria bacterium]|nr:PHP domain-containing protein [Candidatus Eisenbacteria bacterium]
MPRPGPPWAPLRVHSCGSLLWGTQHPRELIERAARLGLSGLALTDRDNLYLAVPALQAADEAGIGLLLGAEITPGPPTVAYALDLDGYGALCRLITRRRLEPDFDLAAALPEAAAGGGLFVATADPVLLESLDPDLPAGALAALVVRGAVSWRDDAERLLRAAASRTGRPVLGSPQITVAEPRQNDVHVLLAAVRRGCLVSQVAGQDRAPADSVWPTAEELTDTWRDDPQALVRSRELIERARLRLADLAGRGPIFPRAGDGDPQATYDRLYRMCHDGITRRYRRITPKVVRRLHRELEVIRRLGFLDYFLVVGRIVGEARRRGIPTVGRGSGAGSIVAYLLGITNVDPIRYSLYFERFLHRLRRDLPDLDIDFCWRRRDEILAWVYEAFGADHVAMISTHTAFHPRSAFREAAKALGVPHGVVNRLCRAVPRRFEQSDGGSRSLRAMVRAGPLGRRIPVDQDPYPRIFDLSERLLGLPRHLGVHPGGIVISDERPIDMYVPLEPATKGLVVTQYEMRAIEKVGLVKIDLLGNRALSTLAEARETLSREGTAIEWDAIPHDDPATGALLRHGHSLGCFQIESPGMRQLLIMTRTHDLEETLHALSLIRPGPAGSGMKDAFIRRVRGEEPGEVRHPKLLPLLAGTHGVMLYEEDVMAVAAAIGGFSLPLGDLLRRAIGAAHGEVAQK